MSLADRFVMQGHVKKQRNTKCSTNPITILPGCSSAFCWAGNGWKACDKLLASLSGFLISEQKSLCISLDLCLHVCFGFFSPLCRQNGKKKMPSFFGLEGGREREMTTDKILQYIPGKNIQNQENQKENLDQRFPSLFKKGRRKTVVRNMGKMIYYSKVKFKFQHCQEVNDCFLELFQSYLYFQSVGSSGLTYQGLLPLKELNVCEIENGKSTGQEDHAFRIAGPLLNPLIVFCPTESELKQWLYHLEKQIQLNGGSLGLPCLSQNDWKQSSMGKEELRWSVQNMPVQEWRGTQRESLGDVLCVSRVKLQHLPFQEQHDRLLVLYPSTLVIVSEERNSLCFKGELPLNAIQVLFEENKKTSFLIEGRLINSIRVICRSYDDYQEWLYCLKTAQFRNADSSLSGSESFSGSKLPHPSQFASSGRGSLTSDGRTNSWASGGRVATLTHLSQNSGSLPDGQSFMLMPESRVLEDPLSHGYSQPLNCLAQAKWPSMGLSAQDLRRGSSARKSKGKCGPCGQQLPSQDTERTICSLIPENPNGELLVSVYNEPYSAHSSQHHPAAPSPRLDLSSLNRWSLVGSQPSTASSSLEKPALPRSSLYADPYMPSSPSAHSTASSSFLQEKRNCQPLPSSRYREMPVAPSYSTPGTSGHLQLRPPADASYRDEISSLREEHLGPSLQPPDGNVGTYDLPEASCPHRDSAAYHDYAELQSFQSDFSYDNLWEAEAKEQGSSHSSPAPGHQFYQA
ncbi:pleckstrin homology domain-containing family N member 1 isoform X2 [Falco rusticolus]|uniref:pleckstrin homology domain-containing family N member 1 isoform X2 n=1 Tax=Falco rusticolus TaxID=120794 RepID=UPI000FFBB9F3|nr:pleckstrin homology domain-containing family N member 1 isoform X2 [Falco rusticolus]